MKTSPPGRIDIHQIRGIVCGESVHRISDQARPIQIERCTPWRREQRSSFAVLDTPNGLSKSCVSTSATHPHIRASQIGCIRSRIEGVGVDDTLECRLSVQREIGCEYGTIEGALRIHHHDIHFDTILVLLRIAIGRERPSHVDHSWSRSILDARQREVAVRRYVGTAQHDVVAKLDVLAATEPPTVGRTGIDRHLDVVGRVHRILGERRVRSELLHRDVRGRIVGRRERAPRDRKPTYQNQMHDSRKRPLVFHLA